MQNRERGFEEQSDSELLEVILRSSEKAAAILRDFKLEDLTDLGRREANLTPTAYKRLQAGIELGRRIHSIPVV